MEVTLINSRRMYRSPTGVDVEKTEEFFAARRVRYEVDDGEEVKQKKLFISTNKLGLDAEVGDIENYLLEKEGITTSEDEDEIEGDDEVDSDDESESDDEVDSEEDNGEEE